MILIPKGLTAMVEAYIRANERGKEYGGWFFGSESRFDAFLPCPNYSSEPWHKYDIGGNGSRNFAKHYSEYVGLTMVAEMHTHPTGSVVSGADINYIRGHSLLYEVVIADMGDKFRWFVVNRDSQEVGVVIGDEQLKQVVFAVAQEAGLTSLGQAFMTPKGELLATSKLGKALLMIDEDATRLQKYSLLGNWRYNRTQASRDLGLSVARVKKAETKLKDHGSMERKY